MMKNDLDAGKKLEKIVCDFWDYCREAGDFGYCFSHLYPKCRRYSEIQKMMDRREVYTVYRKDLNS